MASLNIVMVEPEIPQNTGNVARTCAATGARLHLVEPMGFAIDDKKLKRAGLITGICWIFPITRSLDDFFSEKQRPVFLFFHQGKADIQRRILPDGAYLVFGKETAGLPEELLLKTSGCLCAYSHDQRSAEPESFQLGGGRRF